MYIFIYPYVFIYEYMYNDDDERQSAFEHGPACMYNQCLKCLWAARPTVEAGCRCKFLAAASRKFYPMFGAFSGSFRR